MNKYFYYHNLQITLYYINIVCNYIVRAKHSKVCLKDSFTSKIQIYTKYLIYF